MPAFELVIRDAAARSILAPGLGDDALALVLTLIARMASREGMRFDGLDGGDSQVLNASLNEHLPADPGQAREMDLEIDGGEQA